MSEVGWPKEAQAASAASAPVHERRQAMTAMLRQHGAATVAELAMAFGVSLVTVRQDLRHLAAEGAILRFHGGAVGRS